ncbi:MAG: F0F1 ATP synthase subunit A [Myxococcota bacterium]
MELTPDQTVYFQWRFVTINATIVFGWVVTILLTLISWLVTRNLSKGAQISRWQHFLEALVDEMCSQLRDMVHQDPRPFLPFIGTLFLYIGMSNLLMIVPYYQPPTASLSTTAALALCVAIAVPFFGITRQGWKAYLEHYIEPSVFTLPFNIVSEISRTIALAVRLFGNIMSGTLLVAILVALVPLVFPIIMNALGLLTGMIQAYIFAILAAVYIASGMQTRENNHASEEDQAGENSHG